MKINAVFFTFHCFVQWQVQIKPFQQSIFIVSISHITKIIYPKIKVIQFQFLYQILKLQCIFPNPKQRLPNFKQFG